MLTPRLRKFALAAHVVTSIGWIGAAVAYAALVAAALTGASPQQISAAYLAMEPIIWFAVVPLGIAALAGGLIQSLGTPWGLFRHYWVIFKLVLTVFALTILLENTQTVRALTRAAAESKLDPGGLTGQLIHSGLGIVVLLVITGLAFYKPRGVTKYGWRKQQEGRDAD